MATGRTGAERRVLCRRRLSRPNLRLPAFGPRAPWCRVFCAYFSVCWPLARHSLIICWYVANAVFEAYVLTCLRPDATWHATAAGVPLRVHIFGELLADMTAPADQTASQKRLKFRELAEKRTNRALEAIGRIANLSNRQLYEYEDAEVRKVLKALRDAVSDVEARFASPKGRPTGKFKL